MKDEQLVKRLRLIETLVAECLRAAGAASVRTAPARKANLSPELVRNVLPDRIVKLRDKGFFSKPRTAREVQEKLNPTYSCEVDRVSMALLRLVKRKKLRKASKIVDSKRQIAYVW
jgi:hypothetical protein